MFDSYPILEHFQRELMIFLDVVIASVLAMFVGIERERKKRGAGVRTNMIVGGFTCLLVSLASSIIDHTAQGLNTDVINADPIRLFEAIVLGVSFIGAGTIFKSGANQISGITTAATLLYSSGIGITVALGQYFLAILVTLFALLINLVLNKVFKRFSELK